MRTSSALSIWKVKMGGIKKKFQINALNAAANKTGKISKREAKIETTISRIKAIIL